MNDTYILKNRKAVIETNQYVWDNWMRNNNTVVKKTFVTNDVEVSTVFLGMDHNFTDGDPLIFETIIFGGFRDGEQDRYSTWDQAVREHDDIVKSFTLRCSYCGTLRKNQEVHCESCGGNF